MGYLYNVSNIPYNYGYSIYTLIMTDTWLKILFYSLVTIHHIFIILLILTPPLVMFHEPFWIWAPITVWVSHLIFSPVLVCPATMWENRLRKQMGEPEIKTFFKHYYIEPLKRIWDYGR